MFKFSQRLIILFVIFTLVATGTASGISFVYSYMHFKSSTEYQLKQSAVSYSHELNEVIFGIETMVNTVSSNLTGLIDKKQFKDPKYYAGIQDKLESLAEQFDKNDIQATSFYIRFDPKYSSGTSGVFHADTNGDGILERLLPTDLSLYPPSDREHVGWFYEPLAKNEPAWMKAYYNANINTYMVSYVAPLKINGVPVGIVGADVDFKRLKQITDAHEGSGQVIIVDNDYAFLVHKTYTLKDRIETIDGGKLAYLIDIIKKEKNGTVHYQLNNVSKVLGYSALRNGWTVIVALTEDEAFDGFNRTTLILLGINVLVSLVMASFALFFSRYVNRLLSKNSLLETEVENRTKQLVETNEYLEESVAELESQQAELTLLNNQLEEAFERQTAMQERLIVAEKLAALGEMIAGVAHEMNTPLGTAVTLNSFVKQELESIAQHTASGQLTKQELEESLRQIGESVRLSDKSLHKAADIVELFKLMTQKKELLDLRKVNLGSLLEEVVQQYEPVLSEGQHRITWSCEVAESIATYPLVLKQILQQLFNNTLVHGFDKQTEKTITLSVAQQNNALILRFSDNGLGMSPDMKARAFEPFVSSKKNKGSVGLGLHLVHNLVTQTLEGTIELTSTPSQGTTVVIQFPVLS